MKKLIYYCAAIALMLQSATASFAQTNPNPQSLPYSEDFSSLPATSSVYPDGWNVWLLDAPSSTTFNVDAPISDLAMKAPSDAATVNRKGHNYDGKIGWLNSTARDIGMVLSINTNSVYSVKVDYDFMQIRNPYDGTRNTLLCEAILQYRVGNAGGFTNLIGTEYQTGTNGQIAPVTTPLDPQSMSIVLPSSCDNQNEVQLRWVNRIISGRGDHPSFAVDNLNICPTFANPAVSIAITNGANPSCAGSLVEFTATPVDGGTPSYQWQVNGSNVGANNPVFSSNTLADADVVTCIMTSTLTCATAVNVTSSGITMTIAAGGTADAGTDQSVCTGVDIILNGTVTNATGGIWTTSGDGTFTPNNTTLNATYTPGPNDIATGSVTLTLTTTGGAPCDHSDGMVVKIHSAGPAQPDPITGMPLSVCPPVTLNLATNNDPNADYYTWSAPAPNNGITFNPPSTTNLQTVDLGATPNSTYNVHVVAVNACGSSVFRSAGTRRTVSTPASVTGDVFACPNDVKAYVATPVAGATSYTWSGPAGTLIDGNAVPYTTVNTTVSVTFGPAFSGGSICIAANVACFTSSNKCITVNNAPPQPSLVSGPATVCVPQANVPYSITPVAGATYTWTAPANATIHFGQGTDKVSVSFNPPYGSGDLLVKANSACASSAVRHKSVAKSTAANNIGRPVSVTGQTNNLCGATGVAYTANPLIANASYNWSFPVGTITYQWANGVIVDYAAGTPGHATFVVTAQSGCGVSLPRPIDIKGAANSPALSGPAGVCANSTGNIYSVPSISGVTYTWQVPVGATITAGQGTNSATVSYGASLAAGSHVSCQIDNACGNGTGNLPVSITCRVSQASQANADASKFTAYPNPATDDVTVEFNSAQNGSAILILYDLNGRKMMSKVVEAAEGFNSHTLDLSKIAKGIYVLRLDADGKTVNSRLVIE